MFSWDIQNANDHIKCIKSYCFIAVQYPPSSLPSVHCFYVNVSIKLTERGRIKTDKIKYFSPAGVKMFLRHCHNPL